MCHVVTSFIIAAFDQDIRLEAGYDIDRRQAIEDHDCIHPQDLIRVAAMILSKGSVPIPVEK
jgi:hypothetical protein